MTPEIVSVGGIATDIIMRSSSLPSAGRCIKASELHQALGGKAANQAVAAARLGGSVALVGAVGNDDAGEAALARLTAERVDVTSVARAAAGTGTVVMHRSDAGEKQTVVFSGANAHVSAETIAAAAPLLASARVVLVQFEIPLDTVLSLAAALREGNALLILDPSPIRALPRELLAAAYAIKPNALEATALTGIEVHDLPSARAAALRLLELGTTMVAIEAGLEGNLFMTQSEEVFLPLHDVPSVDATGAGDALIGALAVALAEGHPLREAATFATAAAALTTRETGVQTSMPTRNELERWLAGGVDQ